MATVASYGWRGQYWERDQIAENVTEAEKIPLNCFALIETGAPEKPKGPKEPETFSEMQRAEQALEDSVMPVDAAKEVVEPDYAKKPVAKPKKK